jgi:AcrR family transcriptional regulator
MRKGERTQRAILAHALRVASTEGLEGITIGTLAARARLSKSGLFAHFRSKEALQIALLDAAAEEFRRVVVHPALAAPRGEPRLRATFDHWLHWPSKCDLPGGCVFTGAAAELDDRAGAVRDHLVELQRQWVDTLTRIARGGIEEGHFRSDVDAEQLALEFYGILFIHHLMHRLLRDPRADERARVTLERLLASVRTPSRRKRRARQPRR